MEWYHWTLLTMAVAAGVVSYQVPRAVLWLALGAASFIASAIWHRYGFPYATLFGATTNIAILAMLSRFAKDQWELGFTLCFVLMLMVDLLFVTGAIVSQYQFAVALEVINLLAIMIVMGTGLSDWIWKSGLHLHIPHRGLRDRVGAALHAPRTSYKEWWR